MLVRRELMWLNVDDEYINLRLYIMRIRYMYMSHYQILTMTGDDDLMRLIE